MAAADPSRRLPWRRPVYQTVAERNGAAAPRAGGLVSFPQPGQGAGVRSAPLCAAK
jgi:hypothetical protein